MSTTTIDDDKAPESIIGTGTVLLALKPSKQATKTEWGGGGGGGGGGAAFFPQRID